MIVYLPAVPVRVELVAAGLPRDGVAAGGVNGGGAAPCWRRPGQPVHGLRGVQVPHRGGGFGLGGQPPGLEGVGDALAHGGGDVAVDAAHTGDAVAEALGLGDFGDVVFDQPGLVGVPEVVEVHAFDDRAGVGVRVAVDGGPQTRRDMLERRR
jgi:hypothetical protein